MIKKVMVCLIAFCLLTGCQEVPQQVRDRMNDKGDTKQMSGVDISYCTIEQLRGVSRDTISYEADNIILPERIDFSGIEAVGLVTFKARKDFMKQKEAVADYFGMKVSSWESFDDNSVSYEDYENVESVYVNDNGSFSCFRGKFDKLLQQNVLIKTTHKIHLNREDCPNVLCRLQDGDALLTDVISNTNNWVNQCEYLSHDFNYQPRAVYVREDKDKNNYLSLLYQMMYKGVGLSYIAYPMETLEDWTVLIKAVNPSVSVWCENSSDISGIFATPYLGIEKEELAEQVIDFESALKLAEEKMASYSRLNVAEVRIEYILTPIYPPEEGTEAAEAPGVIMEARPVYSFWIPNGEEDEDTFGINEDDEMVYINVDMLDGTVTDDFEPYSFHGE